MESYPVDVDPAQVVPWLKAAKERSPSALRSPRSAAGKCAKFRLGRNLHLGDEEGEDLNEIETVATLEVAPTHSADG
jgi:hypothetical protein